MSNECEYCGPVASRIWIESKFAVALAPAPPVTDGHTLIVPRRHVEAVDALPPDEQTAFWDLLVEIRGRLLTGLKPDGFHIGFLEGSLSAVPVGHAVVHLVPYRNGQEATLPEATRWIQGGLLDGKREK